MKQFETTPHQASARVPQSHTDNRKNSYRLHGETEPQQVDKTSRRKRIPNVREFPIASLARGETIPTSATDMCLHRQARGTARGFRTGTNMLLGTPIYMSPEQCRGAKTSAIAAMCMRSVWCCLRCWLVGLRLKQRCRANTSRCIFSSRHRRCVSLSRTSMSDWNNCCCRCWPKIPDQAPMLEVAQRLKFLGNLPGAISWVADRTSDLRDHCRKCSRPSRPDPNRTTQPKSYRTTWDHQLAGDECCGRSSANTDERGRSAEAAGDTTIGGKRENLRPSGFP